MKKFQKNIARVFIVAICSLVFTTNVFADQAQVLSQKQVNDALLALKPVREAKQSIMHTCEPCGKNDTKRGQLESLNTLNMKNLGQGQFEMLVNGKAIDLAYVFIPNPDKNGKKWKNLAKHLGISVEGVSTYL